MLTEQRGPFRPALQQAGDGGLGQGSECGISVRHEPDYRDALNG
jgi:hypothetical protein